MCVLCLKNNHHHISAQGFCAHHRRYVRSDFLWLLWVLADKQMWSYYECMPCPGRRIRSEIMLFNGQGPRFSTPTRIPLVWPWLFAAPPVVICLCTVLRSLTRIQMITPRRCKTSSVGQSAGLLILRSSVRFRQKLKKQTTLIYMDLSYIDPQARVLNYFYE